MWAQIRDHWKYAERQDLRLDLEENRRLLGRLLTQSSLVRQLVSIDDEPLDCLPGRLGWTAVEPGAEGEPYLLQLVTGDGQSVAHALTVLPGRETMYLSDDVVFRGPRPWLPGAELEPRHELPAEIVETSQGVDFLVRLGVVLPES